MRIDRLIIAIFIVGFACKPANIQTSSVSSYEEDLSKLRPDIAKKEAVIEENPIVIVTTDAATEPDNKLKVGLDSVNQIIVQRNKSVKYIEGYTVQIYSGFDREAATQAKELVSQLYDSIEAEMTYYQPNYKVKVGEYTNKLEGHKALNDLKPHFPRALLLPARIKTNYE